MSMSHVKKSTQSIEKLKQKEQKEQKEQTEQGKVLNNKKRKLFSTRDIFDNLNIKITEKKPDLFLGLDDMPALENIPGLDDMPALENIPEGGGDSPSLESPLSLKSKDDSYISLNELFGKRQVSQETTLNQPAILSPFRSR